MPHHSDDIDGAGESSVVHRHDGSGGGGSSAPRRSNYIARHWRGDLSLGVSYWINMVLLSIPISIIGSILGNSGFGGVDLRLVPWLFFFFIGGTLLISLWQVVGTWRSASKHKARTGRRFWATVAQVLIVIGLIRLVPVITEIAPVARMMAQVAFDDPLAEFEVSLSSDGRTLIVDGHIGAGITSKVEDLFGDNPGVTTVLLESRGGRTGEGARLGRFIHGRGLVTRVEGLCASACADAFLGGRERILAKGGTIGFHASEEIPGLSKRNADIIQKKHREYYEEMGVPSNVIARILSTPNEDLWTPDPDVLRQFGIVTEVVEASPRLLPQTAGWKEEAESMERELLQHRFYRLIKKNDPDLYRRMLKDAAEASAAGKRQQEIISVTQTHLIPLFQKALANASDGAQQKFVTLLIYQMTVLLNANAQACIAHLSGQSNNAGLRYFPKELSERTLEVMADVVVSAYETPREVPSEDAVTPAIEVVIGALYEKYGDDIMALDDPLGWPLANDTKCRLFIDFYAEIAKLPGPEQGSIMRYMMAHAY